MDILCSFIKQTYSYISSPVVVYYPAAWDGPPCMSSVFRKYLYRVCLILCAVIRQFLDDELGTSSCSAEYVFGHWIKEFISPHKKCKHPTSYVYCCQVIEITQKYYEKYEVRGFHRGAEEDSVVLEYDAMSFTEWLLLFHGNSPSLSSPAQTLKTKAASVSKVSITID